MLPALRSALCAALAGVALAVLPATARVAIAQDLDVISCRELESYYSQRMGEANKQVLACTRLRPANDPWTRVMSDGQCSYWGPRACTGLVQRCSSLQAQYHDAQRQCRRQTDADRSPIERGNPPKQDGLQARGNADTSSPVANRTLLREPLQKFGQEYLKNLGWSLIGPGSPSERMQQVHQRPFGLGLGLRASYQVLESWDVAKAAWELSNALSGPKDKRDKALMNMATESALRVSSAYQDPARMFSTFSFLLLKSMEASILDQLNQVSADIALFGVNNQTARAEQDLWYLAETARWKDYIARASATASTGVDMSTVELVNEIRSAALAEAARAQAAAARAQAAAAAQQARERAEREAGAARDEQARQERLAAARAREQAALRFEMEMERAQEVQRSGERQRAINGIVNGFVGGLTSTPQPAPTYVPPPRQTYTPPPRASGGGGGGNRCPGATIAVDENCRPIR